MLLAQEPWTPRSYRPLPPTITLYWAKDLLVMVNNLCLLFLLERGEILSFTKRPLSERVLKLNLTCSFYWEKDKIRDFVSVEDSFFFWFMAYLDFRREKDLSEKRISYFSTRRKISEIFQPRNLSVRFKLLYKTERSGWLVGWLGNRFFPLTKLVWDRWEDEKLLYFKSHFDEDWRLKIEDWRLKIWENEGPSLLA